MRRVFLFAIALILLVSFVHAADLEVTKVDKGAVIVKELDNPAIFRFTIDNKGENDTFEIYSLVSVTMGPKGFFELPHGETKMDVWARVGEELRKNLGYLTFEYQLKGRKSGIFKDKIVVNIVEFKDVLDISAEPFGPDDTTVRITVKNKEDTNLDNVNVVFDSIFFNGEKSISLNPFEEVNVTLKVNRQPDRANAGAYLFYAKLKGGDENTKIEGVLNYLEKSRTSVEEKRDGFIVRKVDIKKTNDGNIPVTARIEVKKDVVSRLFTLNSIEPNEINRNGFYVTYVWEKYLRPGENLEIETKSNYTFPFILLLIVIAGGILAKIYSLKPISVKKKVSHVRTKNGELALKVTLKVSARKHVDKVQLIDSLPMMTKLYEHFGKKPDKVEVHSRRLFWNLGDLDKGESRLYSYIIYSKLNVVGRFELPSALGLFELNGATREVSSNRAYFARE